MGLLNQFIDLIFPRKFRPERWEPESIDGSGALNTDQDLAEFLLLQASVQTLLRECAVDPVRVLEQVRARRGEAGLESREALRVILHTSAEMHPDRHVAEYLKLLCFGSDSVRQAVTLPGQSAGDVPFRLAHGLEKNADPDTETSPSDPRRLRIWDDNISPMELVVFRLRETFQLDHEQAVQIMLKVHHSGTAVLEVPDGRSSDEFCREANQRWRDAGLALFCDPAPLNAVDQA
jgi:ATP-dependent Clp protease adapter protein ClpS